MPGALQALYQKSKDLVLDMTVSIWIHNKSKNNCIFLYWFTWNFHKIEFQFKNCYIIFELLKEAKENHTDLFWQNFHSKHNTKSTFFRYQHSFHKMDHRNNNQALKTWFWLMNFQHLYHLSTNLRMNSKKLTYIFKNLLQLIPMHKITLKKTLSICIYSILTHSEVSNSQSPSDCISGLPWK